VILIYNPLVGNIVMGATVVSIISIFTSGNMIPVSPINIGWSCIYDWLPPYLIVGLFITLFQILFATKCFSRSCGRSLSVFSLGLIVFSVQIPTYGIGIAGLSAFVVFCFQCCFESDGSEKDTPKKPDVYAAINAHATKEALDDLRETYKAMSGEKLMQLVARSNMTLNQLNAFMDGSSDTIPSSSGSGPVDHVHSEIPPEAVGEEWRSKYL